MGLLDRLRLAVAILPGRINVTRWLENSNRDCSPQLRFEDVLACRHCGALVYRADETIRLHENKCAPFGPEP